MTHHDIVIVGTGSGNSIPGPELDDLDIAIVEAGTFGGTCLNVGCIPTKMYVHAADLAEHTSEAHALGVDVTLDRVRWDDIRKRVFGRIDPLSAGGRQYRESSENPNITLYSGFGKFRGHKQLDIALNDGDATTITGDRFVLAAGTRAVVPDIHGLRLGSRVHTSDTIMRMETLPASLIILGGGFIAAEFGHVFSSFGVEVTQVVRGSRLLRGHDDDISEAFTAVASKRWALHTETMPSAFTETDDGVRMDIPGGSVTADVVLVATGRRPNSDRLAVGATGVDVDRGAGYVLVDDFQMTNVDGIFALGDICSPWQLKHVANHEMRVVRHNLVHPHEMIRSDHRYVPSAVFTHPQIATVGLTEDEAILHGVRHVTARHDYADIAAGWAREDTTGFVKVLADPDTGLLLGAHIIGPEAATVIQPLIQAMSFGQTARDVAEGQYWIHPALPEVIENALLKLPRPSR